MDSQQWQSRRSPESSWIFAAEASWLYANRNIDADGWENGMWADLRLQRCFQLLQESSKNARIEFWMLDQSGDHAY